MNMLEFLNGGMNNLEIIRNPGKYLKADMQ